MTTTATAPPYAAELDETRHVSLCETLDRLLNTGAVVAGDVVISVADIELIYLNLRLMISSVETIRTRSANPPALVGRARTEVEP
jgi:Gas vesicle protein